MQRRMQFARTFGSTPPVDPGIPLIIKVSSTDTSDSSSGFRSIILPFVEGQTVNLKIDWGSGVPELYTDTNELCAYTYSDSLDKEIKIYNLDGPGRIPWNIQQVSSSRQDFSKFTDLKQFGDCEIYQLDGDTPGAFKDCNNLDVTATDTGEKCIKLSENISSLFRSCNVTEFKDSATWDTSNITDFTEAFFFNINLTSIDVSNWEMSQAETIEGIFGYAYNLDLNAVSNWDITQSCTNMAGAFFACDEIDADLFSWDVSKVTDISDMFYSSDSFTGQGLSSWDVSSVETMDRVFLDCTIFNADLSGWNLVSLTNMDRAFYGCPLFEGTGLDTWTTSPLLKSLESTFWEAGNFNADLSSWDVSGVEDMTSTFYNCDSFIGTGLENWVTSSLITLVGTFSNTTLFNGDVSSWNTSSVTAVSYTFRNTQSFNQDLSGWDFSTIAQVGNWGDDWSLDTSNYDALLLSLSNQTLIQGLDNIVMESTYTPGNVDSGTVTSVVANKLIQTGQNFLTTVTIGDIVYNSTDNKYAEVTNVDSDTTLSLDVNIMESGDSYFIQGSDVAKARYDVTYNDSWDIRDDGPV